MTTAFMRGALVAACAAAFVLLRPSDADACGACFHPVGEVSSVVTDHRMVFKISTTETILWDQIRYAGSPKEFAWVLPVHEGARVQLSTDDFIAALQAFRTDSRHGTVMNRIGKGVDDAEIAAMAAYLAARRSAAPRQP